MANVTPEQFLEILRDPTMSEMKLRVIEMIRNPDNQIMDVTTESFHPIETFVTIRLRVNG